MPYLAGPSVARNSYGYASMVPVIMSTNSSINDVSRKRLELRLAEINRALKDPSVMATNKMLKEYMVARKSIRDRLADLPLAV